MEFLLSNVPFLHLGQRDRELLLLAKAEAAGKIVRLPPGKNKSFMQYLRSSARSYSLRRQVAQGSGMAVSPVKLPFTFR